MKYKRVLSLILAVVLLTSLFVGITGTASAADSSSVITHTVKSGEYMYKICQNYGLTYSVCKNAIMLLNGFTTETQLNRIYAGQVIKLPASDALALTVKQEVTIGGGSSSSSSSSSGSTSSGDTIVYYLISYTVKSGDTLVSICNSLGSSYSKYANTILTINGLTSVTRIYAGKTLYIPVDTKPTSGTYYSVVSHKVTSGETITSICSSYGVNYNTNTALVQGLNDGVNLNAIKVGQTVLVPSTKTTSSSGTTPSTTGEYAISIATQTSTSDAGSPYATVNGTTVTKAASGVTVVIKGGSATSSVLQIVKVQRADTKATIAFDENADSFVMPACAVIVTVQYSDGYTINKNVSSGHGSFETYVNDSVVSFAGSGRKVNVKTSPNSGYVVDSVTVKTSSGTVAVTKNTTNSYSFKMPSQDVTVTVKYKQAVYYTVGVTYDTHKKASNYGTAVCKVDGTKVGTNGVAEGVVVTVEGSPANGYSVSKVTVYEKDGTAKIKEATVVSGNTWSFEMPSQNVDVNVEFKRTDKFNLNTSLAWNAGSVKFRIYNTETKTFGDFTTTAQVGDTVGLVVSNHQWWKVTLPDTGVTYANGSAILPLTNVTDSVTGYTYRTFKMPAASITATTSAEIDSKNRFSIVSDPASNVAFRTFNSNGEETLTFAEGETVIFKPVGNAGNSATFYELKGSTYTAITGNPATIKMQGNDVGIKAVLTTGNAASISAKAEPEGGLGTLRVLCNDAEVANSNSADSASVYTGNKLTFSITEGTDESGYKYSLSKLVVSVGGEVKDITSTYSSGYTLPSDAAGKSVIFTATFKAENEYKITKTVQYEETSGKTGCDVTVNTSAKAGETVYVTPSVATGYALKSLTVNGSDIMSTLKDGKYSFEMSSQDTSVVATFSDQCYVSTPDSVTYLERVFITGKSSYTEARNASEGADEGRSVTSGGSVLMFLQLNSDISLSTHKVTVTVDGTEMAVQTSSTVHKDANSAGYWYYVTFTASKDVKPVVKIEALPAVNAPTFKTEQGEYVLLDKVEINVEAGTTVYYTTDGSTPTKTSTTYDATNGISISGAGTYTFKAVAIPAEGSGKAPSSVVTGTYTKLDKIATPVVSTTSSTATSTITATCTTKDAEIYYQIDSGSWQQYTVPFEVSSAAAVHIIGLNTSDRTKDSVQVDITIS